MKEKDKKYWEKIRGKGKKHFILYRGMIGWGITTGILFSIINTIMIEGIKGVTIGDIIGKLIISIIAFPIGGYFWGLWVWNIQEKKYKKSQI